MAEEPWRMRAQRDWRRSTDGGEAMQFEETKGHFGFHLKGGKDEPHPSDRCAVLRQIECAEPVG